MSDRKWIPDPSGPFEALVYPGTDKVEFIRCQLCKEHVFDDHKDNDAALTPAAVMHLTLSHGDRYELREPREGSKW